MEAILGVVGGLVKYGVDLYNTWVRSKEEDRAELIAFNKQKLQEMNDKRAEIEARIAARDKETQDIIDGK